MKKILIVVLNVLFCALSFAQESGTSLHVMTLPTSTRVAALGGENVTVVDATPGIAVHNPALLANIDRRVAGLNFMTYADGTNWMGANYAMPFGDRHTGAAFVQYLGYGSMQETDAQGNVIGSFSPKDMILGVGYSYLFSDRWSGGANFKAAHSRIADFSSLALAFDLGLNYYDPERMLSVSAVMRNLGAQVKTFDGVVEHVPFNLEAGVTKGLDHLPVDISLTLVDLTRWKRSDLYQAGDKKMSVGRLALNHVVLGLDVHVTDYMYVAAGYNFRRGYELKAAGSSGLSGLSAGVGLNLRAFSFGLSWSRYHKTVNSFMGNVAYRF